MASHPVKMDLVNAAESQHDESELADGTVAAEDQVSDLPAAETMNDVQGDSHVQIIAEGGGSGKRLEQELDDEDVEEMDVGRRSGKKQQRYRPQWEQHPSLQNWVGPVPGDQYRAWCRQCGCQLVAQLKVLLDHSLCRKHARRSGRKHVLPAATLQRSVDAAGGIRAQLTGSSSVPAAGGFPAMSPQVGWSRSAHDRTLQPDVQYDDADRVTLSIGLGELNVGFIGAGKIAQAIAMGMMNKGVVTVNRLMVSAPSNRNKDVWKCWKCRTTSRNVELVRRCDLVFLAVAPADLVTVIASLEPLGDGRERCFVSTVSGVPLARLTEMLNEQLAGDAVVAVRCVPSRTVAIGEGFCVYSGGDALPDRWLLCVETIFSALGVCQRAAEHLMDAHSGAFSSGVAFVAQFIDALAAGAANQGICWEEAVQLAAQITQGTASMVLSQGVMPSEVRREACTPGGNSIAGMMALQKGGMEFAVMSAVEEATKKARELGDYL